MAINDPYDRSGQYAGGDTGPKVDGFGSTGAFGPDRRDVAIGTMMGEGGPFDNRQGYAGVLDSIENRISAVSRGANYGQKNDHTLQGIAQARKGAEYNAWSPKQKEAYGQATRGARGTPRAGAETRMYDQALSVYDDYYQGVPGLKGVAMGGTFYQNDALLAGKKVGKFQRDMQNKYGSVPIGRAGHVATGPGLDLGRNPAAGYEPVDPAITGSFGMDLPAAAFDDPITATPAPTPAPATVKGFSGTNALRSAVGTDMLQPARARTSPTGPQPITGSAGVNQLRGSMAADPIATAMAPRESHWTPGPVARAAGSNATGQETQRTSDGVVHDKAGAYGGGEAFGPNDPFGGLGFSNKGYADVVDSFDRALGGITRTVRDQHGNIIGQHTASGFAGGDMLGVDGIRSDGRGTGDTGFSGGERGDGSYSSESGRNDNSPQGIL